MGLQMTNKDLSYNSQYDLYVPAYEERLLQKDWFAKTYRNMPKEVKPALSLLDKKRNCIQAGACFGIYPNYLAQFFQTVFTFEPNPILFECCEKNIKAKNVWKANYALGAEETSVELHLAKCGADSVIWDGYKKRNTVHVVQTTIDSLKLEDVDFIMLDIERYEKQALIGAQKTIELCKPVIQVEMHDLARDELTAYLEGIGYEFVGPAGSRDEVWIHHA